MLGRGTIGTAIGSGEGEGVAMNPVEVPTAPTREASRQGSWGRALFEAIDDAVFIHDLEGHFLDANPAACRRLGYTREELLRLTTRDIDEPEFGAAFAQRLHTQLSHGHLVCEGRHVTRDGRVIPVDINTSTIDLDGKPAVLAVMRDITERKRAEDHLRQQTQMLQSILDHMGDGVIVADENERFLVFNPAAERMFGLGSTDTTSSGWSEKYGLYLPDMETPFPSQQLPLLRAIRGEEVDEVEMFVRHARAPEGIWASITGRPLRDDQGRLQGGVIVCRDITERKRAERRLTAQVAVTQALAESATLAEAAPKILQAVCESVVWDLGAIWSVDPAWGMLHCVDLWHVPGIALTRFVEATRQTAFAPGIGLPGRVWASGEPAWVADVVPDPNFPRNGAAMVVGLHGAFAVPIRSAGLITGVLEFFGRRTRTPDKDLLEMMTALGSQIGQFIDRKRNEAEVQQVNAFLDSVVDNIPNLLFVKDAELLRFERVNKAAETILGFSREELLGKSDYDLFPRQQADFFTQKDREVLEGRRLVDISEEEIRTREGTRLFHTRKLPILDDQGEPRYLLGISEDVTEHKALEETRRQYAEAREQHARELERNNQALAKSEHRYRQLTQAALGAIVVADAQQRITLFNPAAERTFGYQEHEVLGRNLQLIMPEEYRQKHAEGFARYLATRQSRVVGRSVELRGLRRDGTEFPVELSLSAVDLGDEVQFLGVIRDLTERNRMRTAMIQSEKLASIGLLSAGVAHEINNPLAYVANNLVVLDRDTRGLLSLLEIYEQGQETLAAARPDLAERLRTLAEDMDLPYVRTNLDRLLIRTRDGVTRVTRIIQSLRNLARTAPPELQEASIPDLVEAALEIIRGQLRRRGIEVEQQYADVGKLRCVPNQVGQVLVNLLVNAMQAVEARDNADGGRIRVSAQRADDEVLIEVADNGCGIDPRDLPRLFDPFFTTKPVGEGTGLGLSISHNIVTGHGGRIEVDSRRGEGTRFRVFLPLNPHVPT
jgi:PAS domain S-box-containing protein